MRRIEDPYLAVLLLLGLLLCAMLADAAMPRTLEPPAVFDGLRGRFDV